MRLQRFNDRRIAPANGVRALLLLATLPATADLANLLGDLE